MSKNEAEKKKATQPERSRAVFSQEDFDLIRVAVAHYLQVVRDQPEAMKYSNLYHRLGRIS
ncbi:hypothetical protein NKI50_28975 [Mesorhizobium sp. M0563]|uniref:hypothetical protein n=1 Tax=Mesorhizobium sp. M0563 TaxID=2956959 RepID=UPI003335547F